jgi:beta-mannanase
MRPGARAVSFRTRTAIATSAVVGLLTGPIGAAGAEEQVILTGQDMVMAGFYSAEWESYDDLTALTEATGKQVTFSGTFHNAAREPAWITDWILEQSWQAQTTPFANVTIPDSARAVARGDYDDDISRWAAQVKTWLDRGENRSLFVAPFQEMNGTWTPYGGDPANFKIAYRKVVDAFRDMGVDETRVRFVFAPDAQSSRPYRIADYYPGGPLVDVMGLSAYNFGPTLDRWTTVPETMDSALAELRAVGPRKPIVIAQVGASPIDGSQVFWLQDMFRYLTADPQVVGFVYFNFDKETDWRVWTGATLSDGWRMGMARDTTVHVWPLRNWFQPGPLPFSVDGSTPMGWFVDDAGSPFYHDIQWLVERRITNGCDGPIGDRFCPEDPVPRAQMASFIARAFELPPATTEFFVDARASGHGHDIDRIAQAGITLGCGDERFCSYDLVDRGQMASFLVRALGLPATGTDHFTDDDGSPHEAAINSMASFGLVFGCAESRFCPDRPVTRGEMAALLARSLGG